MSEVTKTEASMPPIAASSASDADLVIAYLLYAVKDVRALSARSTQLLEGAIATLIEETRDKGMQRSAAPAGPRSSTMLC